MLWQGVLLRIYYQGPLATPRFGCEVSPPPSDHGQGPVLVQEDGTLPDLVETGVPPPPQGTRGTAQERG